RVSEAWELRRKDLIRQVRAGHGRERPAVDRIVDRLSERYVAAEERPAGIEHERAQREAGATEELPLVDAVLPHQPAVWREVQRRGDDAPVGPPVLNSVEHVLWRAARQIGVEARDVVWSRAAVKAIAPDRDPLALPVLGDVV